MTASVQQILKTAEALPGPELEQLVTRLIEIRSSRMNTLTRDETELLSKINHPFPRDLSRRYESLLRKQETGLTTEERRELLELNDRIETLDAEKIAHLKRLAEIRGVGLDDLMAELGIRPKDHV